MKGFDAKFIDELKNKNDIIDVVGRYVRLEQKGGNFWGKCPFHHEKTASFCVNAQGQFYYCFGCHKSGDVISFIMEIEALDFNDAVKLLAERVKMTLPEIRYDDEKVKEQKKKKERGLALLKDTAMFYVSNIRSGNATKHLDYVEKRGLSPQTVTKFGIGASLNFNDLPKYLLQKGYTYEEMTSCGVVDVKDGRYYDALGGRLITPIIDAFGQVVAFGGRLLEKADFAKYKNTKETFIFNKSNILYNINNLKKLKNEKGLDGVIIVEGYMDTISLVQAGIPNVVASMGTSLTKDQARILKRYTEKVFISYDGDFAGQKAAIRGLEILRDEGLEVKVVAMPEGLDPDDVIKKFGADGYKKLLLEAKPLIDFKLDIVRKTFDVNTVDGKRKLVTNAIKVIKESPSPAEQEDLLKIVRDWTGITFESLNKELNSISNESQKPKEENEVHVFNDDAGDKTVKAERFILSSYLFNKPYAKETDISVIEFFLPAHREIKEYVLDKTSRGEEIKFNSLYEMVSDENKEELSKIAGLEIEENDRFDKAVYFFDCIKTLKAEKISREINKVTALIASETDTAKRKELTSELSKLIIEKNRLSK